MTASICPFPYSDSWFILQLFEIIICEYLQRPHFNYHLEELVLHSWYIWKCHHTRCQMAWALLLIEFCSLWWFVDENSPCANKLHTGLLQELDTPTFDVHDAFLTILFRFEINLSSQLILHTAKENYFCWFVRNLLQKIPSFSEFKWDQLLQNDFFTTLSIFSSNL